MDLNSFFLDVVHLPQQFHELMHMLFHGLGSQFNFIKFPSLPVIVSGRKILLFSIFLELVPIDLLFIDTSYNYHMFPPNKGPSLKCKNGKPSLFISIVLFNFEIPFHPKKPCLCFLSHFRLSIEGMRSSLYLITLRHSIILSLTLKPF